MKTVTLVFNAASLAFTLLVIATDGLATEATFVVLTLLLVLVPAGTLLALARPAAGRGAALLAALGNLLLLAAVVWVLVRYPHTPEPGFVPYAVLIAATPLLSAAVLLLRTRSRGALG